MDRIIETLYSDAVTVTFDIVLGFGDTAAYTVIPSESLKNSVKAP
jgi:hypothetical protein